MHKDLDLWQAAIDLAREVYETTRSYPEEEKFGLVSQMRRSAVSIPSNIAEGAARNSNKEFLQFLYIALGSISELDTQIEISKAVEMADVEELQELQECVVRVRKLTSGLIRSQKHNNLVSGN